ncbi:MAG: hypothetical protein ACXV7D_16830, partial [Thermoanaerobaculia bacterium]
MTLFRDADKDDDQTVGTTRPWWRERRVVITAAVIFGLLILLLLWRRCHAAPADEAASVEVSVQVAKAERGPIANDLTMVATLVARREATLSSKISAQIAQMPLLTNRPVHAGDVLAVLESRDLSAQRSEAAAALQEAQASVNQTANGSVPLTNAQDQKAVRDARAALDNARKTLERRETLYKDGGISKKDLEASQLAVVNA